MSATRLIKKPVDDTKLPLAGGTMTGAINMDNNDLSAVKRFNFETGSGVVITEIKDEDDMDADGAGFLATQQSIKAYADLMLPLAGGTMTGQIVMTSNGNSGIDMNAEAIDDLGRLYFDASGSNFANQLLDEDGMDSDNVNSLCTQQSIKAYVDKTQTCAISHNFYASGTGLVYIPFGGSQTESGVSSYTLTDDTVFMAPYDGTIIKIMLYNDYNSTATPGNTDCKLRVNGSTGSAMNSGGVVAWFYKTSREYICDQNNTFSKGDLLRVGVDPTSAPRYVAITTVWEFDTTT